MPACREAIEPARGLGQPLAEGLAERLELLQATGACGSCAPVRCPLHNVHGSGSISAKPIRRPPSGLPLDLDDPVARAVSSCDVQLKPSPINLALSDGAVHASAHRLASGAIETSTECWAYALVFHLNDRLGLARSARAVVTAELEVIHGRVGVGCLNLGGDAYLMERFADAAHAVSRRIVLRVPASGISDIVFRNATPLRLHLLMTVASFMDSAARPHGDS